MMDHWSVDCCTGCCVDYCVGYFVDCYNDCFVDDDGYCVGYCCDYCYSDDHFVVYFADFDTLVVVCFVVFEQAFGTEQAYVVVDFVELVFGIVQDEVYFVVFVSQASGIESGVVYFVVFGSVLLLPYGQVIQLVFRCCR